MTRALSVIDSIPSDTTAPLGSARSTWTDWMGIIAAIGCAIHCAAMPFVIAYLPALGLSFLADEAFHKWMAIGCFAIAVSAFVPGFRRHGRLTPVLIGSAGLALISFAAFGAAGDCCPSSESAKQIGLTDVSACTDAHCQDCPTESSAASANSPTVSESIGVTACTEAHCQDCPSQTGGESVGGSEDSPRHVIHASPTWLGFVLPWLTPLGGFALVGAHLLNRRHCSCCSCESAESSSPAKDSAV